LIRFSDKREIEMKDRPFADDAIERDRTAMALHDLSRNAEAEPRTSPLSHIGRVGLGEPLENPGTEFFGYARPPIGDGNPDTSLGPRGGNLDASSGRGKFHGVRDQIGDRLIQPSRISRDDCVGLVAGASELDSEACRVGEIC
jgi:hypothetical protein